MSNGATAARAASEYPNEEAVGAGLEASPHGESFRKIERILSFPMDHVIARYSRDHDVPLDLAREHEKELKRFFSLAALNPTFDYGMAGPVDALWHTFILFTREYAEFCESQIGRFLHHYPDRIYTDEVQGANVTTNDTLEWYAAYLRDYVAVFGEKPPAHIWPDLSAFPAGTIHAWDLSLCRICGTDPYPT